MWFSSYKYRPKHGTQIFIWDLSHQKMIMLNAFWDFDNWKPNPNFPAWSYVLNGHDPESISDESRKK